MTTPLSTLSDPIAGAAGNLWQLTPLSEILDQRLETPDPEAIQSGEIPILAKISFNSGQIELRSEGKTNTKMILVRPGDLVVSGINAIKGAIGVYPEDARSEASATIHYTAYKINRDRADKIFLWWLLRSNVFQRILANYLPGGIKTELKAKHLLSISIPLPSLKEQQRLVAKIERLAAKIAEVRCLRHSSTIQGDALFKAELNALANNFSDIGIMNRILTGKPRNGWSPQCDNAETGTPVLTLSAITGFHYDSTAYKRTSLPTNRYAHYWVRRGDFLISRSNTPELVGHAAICDGQPERCIYPDLMMLVPINENLADKKFVWYWLQTPLVRQFIVTNAKGTSPTMKKISQGTVQAIPFPVGISLTQQRKIANYLDNVQEKVKRLTSEQTKIMSELNTILHSIVEQAFKGVL